MQSGDAFSGLEGISVLEILLELRSCSFGNAGDGSEQFPCELYCVLNKMIILRQGMMWLQTDTDDRGPCWELRNEATERALNEAEAGFFAKPELNPRPLSVSLSIWARETIYTQGSTF